MSILVKPYEISIWDDVWDATKQKFVEKRITIIGTDTMQTQNKALEPTLTRNVNGTKKLSFKMYKKYIDIETGEEVDNPFMDYMISERKVKLKYGQTEEGKDRWYDFIIKDITETSTNYLYQFNLEDAIVQELSKNGFGVILDAKLNNNMGNAKTLGEKVLRDTDWTVDSEIFVQTVEEHLVYVRPPSDLNSVTHLLDQTELNSGIEERTITDFSPSGKTFLAFYSSCTNKPHRFQFICLDNDDIKDIELDENQIILNKDCQYFIEYEPSEYTSLDSSYNFALPRGWSVVSGSSGGEAVEDDTTISYKYRGARYGYAQQAVYLPKLNRYANIYKNGEVEYYGYADTEYVSPVLLTNYISNTEFKNTSGWSGVYFGGAEDDKGSKENRAIVENIFGTFLDGEFVNAMDIVSQGEKVPSNAKAYMKLFFPSAKAAVLNSSIRDNRSIIGNLEVGDKLILKVKDHNGLIPSGLKFDLVECKYDTTSSSYIESYSGEDKRITFQNSSHLDGNDIFEVVSTSLTKDDFKKDVQLQLKITGNLNFAYYIQEIELYKYVKGEDGNPISLAAKDQAESIQKGIVNATYYYFNKAAYDRNPVEEKDITFANKTTTLSYETYKPVYNTGAEKIRSVTAAESNYFNILQSIAETFECWLDFDIQRDDQGSIETKKVKFKNYAGADNYAAFRYGVNLKDIQRTFASKDIVTKLIVKNNSNELAPNGFCSIQRAHTNMTGENYIYDFQYYHNTGLLNAGAYLNELYNLEGAMGPDKGNANNINLKGYYPRLKAINSQMLDYNEKLSGVSAELLQLKAEKEVVDATVSAAISGIESTEEDFNLLTGYPIDGYAIKNYPNSIDIDSKDSTSGQYYVSEQDFYSISINRLTDTVNSEEYRVTATFSSDNTPDSIFYTDVTCYITIDGKYKVGFPVRLKFDGVSSSSVDNQGRDCFTLQLVDTNRSDIKKLTTSYLAYTVEKISNETRQTALEGLIATKQAEYDDLNNRLTNLRDTQKAALNKEFFTKYSRFIQEGTWIDEQYVDDNKYYADAQSVLYNSCYPKVSYTINVLSLSQLPGYELFNFEVGDKTYVEDEEFFGVDENNYPNREEIIITEMVEMLDSPSQNSIKVQNFKNQFQDLFQKITATVQQAQYSTGSYKKAVALVEGSEKKKSAFMNDALQDPDFVITSAGQKTVVSDNAGITITNTDNPSEQLRLVSSGILFSHRDGKWRTGLTPEGISADLIKAGRINTGEIQIMSGNNPTFLWDAYGINAFDGTNQLDDTIKVNEDKFVRFDRFGIYGVNGTANGRTWHPTGVTGINNIDEKATFALTWDGLKVTGDNGVVARIGKQENNIIEISKDNSTKLLEFTNTGILKIGDWNISTEGLERWTGEETEAVPTMFLSATGREVGNKTIVFKAGDDFMVSDMGAMYASAGQLAGWNITSTILYKNERKQVTLYNRDTKQDTTYTYQGVGIQHPGSGQCAFAAGFGQNSSDGTESWSATAPFYVKHDGSLYAAKGEIGGFNITQNYLAHTGKTSATQGEGVYLSTDEIGLGTNFYVSKEGKMEAKWADIGDFKVGYDFDNKNMPLTSVMFCDSSPQENGYFDYDGQGTGILLDGSTGSLEIKTTALGDGQNSIGAIKIRDIVYSDATGYVSNETIIKPTGITINGGSVLHKGATIYIGSNAVDNAKTGKIRLYSSTMKSGSDNNGDYVSYDCFIHGEMC